MTSLFNVLLVYSLAVFTVPSEAVTVTVKSTKFIGSMQIVDDIQVNAFLGIPYAQSPTGKLRFKKPVPIQESKPTVDAREWPPACQQNDLFKEIIINKKVSEDCLYLNIWSPKNSSERNYEEEPLRPVLFWIHGGAYISDSASREIYDGQQLAAKSNVVIVTFNYRVDIFGFLYTGTDDAPGNVGLWDQALALEWVIDNIAYFGGDPKQITLIGENAGAFSIGVHLLSPITRNLFQNAVMISGSALNYIIGENPESAKEKWLKVVKEVECGTANNFTDEVISCLRTKEADKLSQSLLKLSQTTKPEKTTEEITPQVIFGDQFLPEDPKTMLFEGDHKRNVNIMIGHTDDEGGYMLPMVDMEKYALNNPKDLSREDAFDDLKKLSASLISKTPIDGEKVAKSYIDGLKSSDSKILRRTLGTALGDFYITCPTILFAKQLVRSEPNKVKAYHYYWTRKVSDSAVPCADWMGACHATDTYMLFGQPFVDTEHYTDGDRNASLNLIRTIAHFANHGKPLAQEEKEWPSYYVKDEEVIAPYFEFSNDKKTKKKTFAKNLKTKECETLWKKYII